MKLNHLNLTVTDVNGTREFLEKYFGLQTISARGDSFVVMSDDNGSLIALTKGKKVRYPGTFHIGFVQESEEKVNEINQRLKNDGFDVKPPQKLHRWTFYVKSPGGFMVEVLN